MNTPIFDFIEKYISSHSSRLHMPGHKGINFLGCEAYDITEIKGADNLYAADGIIKESENNAASIFNTSGTFYSTEGSSLCIRAMIYAALINNGGKTTKKIAAVRNVHKSFISACAMLDIDIDWIYPKNHHSLCSGTVTPEEVDIFLSENNEIFALYLTSPNYLGEITDINGISQVCKKHNVPLLVDNAHGAYLKFCGMHPIDLGADMCCDSAHKTLPVLTGGAYLHISQDKPEYNRYIKNAMSIFGSTSPSYLTLASLDLCNKYLDNTYEDNLQNCIAKVSELKNYLSEKGFDIAKTEPLKITILCNGEVLSELLRENGIECEYCDKTAIVMMVSPQNSDSDFERIKNAFSQIKPVPAITPPEIKPSKKVMTVRDAFLYPYRRIDIKDSVGEICLTPCVSCPPAIPIAVSGEIITEETVFALEFYGIDKINIK